MEIYAKFLNHLASAIRKTGLYPFNHPSVVSSLNEFYSALQEIIGEKEMLTLNVTSDKKIIIDDAQIDKGPFNVNDLLTLLDELEIENITFFAGITQKEAQEFIRILLFEEEKIEEASDINKMLVDNGIEHIKIAQFSYVKIKKDEEKLIAPKDLSLINKLKAKIKDYRADKIKDTQEIAELEKEILNVVINEYKEKKSIGTAVKNLLKSFLRQHDNSQDTLQKLKNALLELGAPTEEIDKLIKKIEEDIAQKPKLRSTPIPGEASQEIIQENRVLRQQLEALKQQLNSQTVQITNFKKETEIIRTGKERIDNIVHHMAEGMVVIGPQGEILMANPTAESLLGITKQDIGKPIKEVVKSEHLLSLVKSMPQEKEGVIEKDIELFSPAESTKRVLRTSSAVVADHNGNTVGMVTTLNDITKQKELDNLKNTFVANVSHELRTPLVSMEKSLSLILTKTAGEINKDQEQFLNIAQRNLKRLALLINDLLDLSKLEAGKLQLKRELTPIKRVIDESVEGLNTWAKTKGIHIESIAQEGLPELNIDPNRLIQVLNNLIGNAIKFTPRDGKITVEAKLAETNREIQVSITDTGIGILKENLPKIFSKFYQIGERSASDIGGTGIGLSIAKEIVELHGGRIWVESEHGQGAKFAFILPLS
jgi:PAS domain S-box-containing protein